MWCTASYYAVLNLQCTYLIHAGSPSEKQWTILLFTITDTGSDIHIMTLLHLVDNSRWWSNAGGVMSILLFETFLWRAGPDERNGAGAMNYFLYSKFPMSCCGTIKCGRGKGAESESKANFNLISCRVRIISGRYSPFLHQRADRDKNRGVTGKVSSAETYKASFPHCNENRNWAVEMSIQSHDQHYALKSKQIHIEKRQI